MMPANATDGLIGLLTHELVFARFAARPRSV
jgi:hypothetical protein